MRASDQDVRDRIVTERSRAQLVEAAAGTGKTTLLITRVLSRLAAGTPISRLAVITFTRKAAAELVARLRRELSTARANGNAWAARALDELDLSFVGTIDSFCRVLLNDFPIEARVPPGFQIADELVQRALMDAAWTSSLERSSASTARVLSRLREAGVKTSTVRAVADQLLAERDLAVGIDPPRDEPDLVDSFGSCLEAALALRSLCRDPDDHLAHHLDQLERELILARSLGGTAAERILLQRRRVRRRYSCRRGRAAAWGGTDEKMRVVVRLQKLEDTVEAFVGARGTRLASEVHAWLGGYFEAYRRIKQEQSLLDFRDLAIHTRDLLRGKPSVRRRVAARFDEILMDEAQDTDPLQMEIAFLLCAREPIPPDPLDAQIEPGKLFLVGDPKQSIYRFRRADLELYARARDVLNAGEAPRVIQANFRSHPKILDFVNELFGEWMGPNSELQASYVPLLGGTESEAPGAVSVLLPDPEIERQLRSRGAGSSLRRRERGELEVDAVTRLIRAALGAGGNAWTVRERGSGETRTLRPSDVAVLVRKIEWGDRLLDALLAEGIPAAVAGGKRFYAREEIQTLLTLLEAILRPEDSFARFAALRSPALGFSDDQLVRHFLDPDPKGAVREAEERLAQLTEHARTGELPDFLERLAEDLSLLASFGFRPDGRGRVEALRLLLEESEPLAANGVDSLPAYVRWLRGQSAAAHGAGSDETDPAVNGVQILTIHKSKGLEFPVVVLADLSGEPSRDLSVVGVRREGRLEFRLSESEKIATARFDEASEEERRRQEAEEVRLLYVAMTRARDRLVISWMPGESGFSSAPPLVRRLGPPGIGSPESDLQRISAADLPAREEISSVPEVESRPTPPKPRPHPDRVGALRGRRVFAATSLDARIASLPRETNETPRVFRGKGFGRLIHKALETWDPRARDVERTLARAAAELAVPLEEEDFGEAQRYLGRVLEDPAVQAIWRAPRLLREVPFLLPVGEDFVSGTIDALVEAGDGALSIVDFKTESLGPAGPERAKERFRPQALVYAEAAARITGRPVREVRFLFLSADPVESGSFLVDPEFLLEARAVIGAARMR